ncbi:competence protein CoiA [Lederbergia lenta]|uniref:competence protein CoiA n=1 Tax=Lederbergia lenta TaxID=1467 RepID=UPI00203A59B7|nr:competence protein CoiA family protein [Lederbergia lenta]MCM3110451.1 hypothetical protein [Lederbergia lenta]
MLTALNELGDIISLAESYEEKALMRMRSNKSFYCPQCMEPLIIKAGNIRVTHFSHKKNSMCTTSFSDPESEQHLKGKKDLQYFFSNKGLETHLEYYLKDLRQRPDLLVAYKTNKYAIEFQCSVISRKILTNRTSGYISEGIKTIWIYGGLPYHKRYGSIYELTDFHFSLAMVRNNIGLSILSYYPKNKTLYILGGIIPITTRKVYATLYSLKLKNLTLPFNIRSKPNNISSAIWLKEKYQWIANKVRFGTLQNDLFLKAVYTAGENPFLLPTICGIPTKHMENFYSHPCEWQFYIYQDCILKLKVGQKISLKYVNQRVRNRINHGNILIRTFPMQTNTNWETTVEQFFISLTELEYFLKIGEDLFELLKQIPVPKTQEKIAELEESMYEKWGYNTMDNSEYNQVDCLLFGKQDL